MTAPAVEYCHFTADYGLIAGQTTIGTVSGIVWLTPTIGSFTVTDGAGTERLVPKRILLTVKNNILYGPDGTVGVDVPAGDILPGQTFGYTVEEVFNETRAGETYTVLAPTNGTVALQDAARVDPTTLDPEAVPEAAWWVALEALSTGAGVQINDTTASGATVFSSNKSVALNTALAATVTTAQTAATNAATAAATAQTTANAKAAQTDLTALTGVVLGKANTTDVTTSLTGKADLVAGKVPASQLPTGTGTSDPGYDIIIGFGQSNMSGRGTPFDTVISDPANSRIFQYATSGGSANTIIAAGEPLAMIDTPTGIGPLFQFARRYARRFLTTGRNILLVPVAQGGTALVPTTGTTWNSTPTTSLYHKAVVQAQAAITAGGTGSRIVASLWIQGETDGDSTATGPAYQTAFDALIAKWRTDLTIPTIPFIVGQMVPDYLSTGTRAQIDAVQKDTPNRLRYTDFASGTSGNTMGDGNHYNAAGQRLMAAEMFTRYENVIVGLAPNATANTNDVTAPTTPGTPTATAAAGSIGLTWTASTDAVGVTGYNVYRSDAPTVALTTKASTNSFTDSTATVGTAYTYTVAAFDAAGNTSAKSASSNSATATAPVVVTTLGVTGSPAAAYSFRRVVSNYAGSAIQVRRSSDSTTQNIGFASGGGLDTVSLLAFCGAGDGFVQTIYDQSGNSRDITQATAGAQPKIVSAGAVIAQANGTPACTFDGVDDVLFRAGFAYALGAFTVFAVMKATVPTTSTRWWAEGLSTAGSPQYSLNQPDYSTNRGLGHPILTTTVSPTDVTLNTGSVIFDGTIHQHVGIDTGSAFSSQVDGGTIAPNAVAYTRTGGYVFDRMALGGVVRSGTLAPLAMTFSEFVGFPAAPTTGDRGTANGNQKTFFGTP